MLTALTLVLLTMGASAQQSDLGRVDFPTSGSEKSQSHFLRGLAALYSFWYEEALDEFRLSTKVDPTFMMGYWGEAMAHNRTLWGQQDLEAARKVLENIKDTGKLTARERAYLNAIKVLYGSGSKGDRDKAYSAAMEKIYREYPEDLEAACFYALSLLGMAPRPEARSFSHQMKAAAICLDVYQKNPNHPGAAHYIIHAFDDPEHAILALPAARRYAKIAPEAHHARHMPSHIFLQLGMWPEAAASNESAWAVSDAWVKRKNLSISLRDYHSLHWLLYVYLQQGRYGKAEELLGVMRSSLAESAGDNKSRANFLANSYAAMAAAYVVETERWDLAAKLFDAQSVKKEEASRATAAGSADHASHGTSSGPAGTSSTSAPPANPSETLATFIKSLVEAKKGSRDPKRADAGSTATTGWPLGKDDGGAPLPKEQEIRLLEVAAVSSTAKGDFTKAIEGMRKATKLEESLTPPFGPPGLIKPSHELYGEILLEAGRPKEAAEQFAISLSRQPNRARSLLGAARAAARAGDEEQAADLYGKFLSQWRQADAEIPEMIEAKSYSEGKRER